MCTVTVVPTRRGARLACNRDERRTRPAALPPSVYRLHRRVGYFPLDPASGGTWIGINDARLAAVLLNRTVAAGTRRSPACSRGTIVPQVLRAATLADALRVATALDARRFDLFRLVLLHHRTVALIASDGCSLSIVVRPLAAPLMVTSSSLGDAIVERPRRALFDRLVRRAPSAWADAQRRFHAHRWPALPALSVVMSRDDARTVSRTVVDVTNQAMALNYEAVEEHR